MCYQTKALFTTTAYSFDSHSRNKTFNLLDTKTGKVSIALSDTSASEVYWLGDSIAYLKGSEDIEGGTDLWISRGDKYVTSMNCGLVYARSLTLKFPLGHIKLVHSQVPSQGSFLRKATMA